MAPQYHVGKGTSRNRAMVFKAPPHGVFTPFQWRAQYCSMINNHGRVGDVNAAIHQTVF